MYAVYYDNIKKEVHLKEFIDYETYASYKAELDKQGKFADYDIGPLGDKINTIKTAMDVQKQQVGWNYREDLNEGSANGETRKCNYAPLSDIFKSIDMNEFFSINSIGKVVSREDFSVKRIEGGADISYKDSVFAVFTFGEEINLLTDGVTAGKAISAAFEASGLGLVANAVDYLNPHEQTNRLMQIYRSQRFADRCNEFSGQPIPFDMVELRAYAAEAISNDCDYFFAFDTEDGLYQFQISEANEADSEKIISLDVKCAQDSRNISISKEEIKNNIAQGYFLSELIMAKYGQRTKSIRKDSVKNHDIQL